MVDHSPVRGCMVIKPWGMGIWDTIRNELDCRIKDTDTRNAYFPLLIPKSFLAKESEHVDGFAKECAVVTHHRLCLSPDGKDLIPDPAAKLEVHQKSFFFFSFLLMCMCIQPGAFGDPPYIGNSHLEYVQQMD
jgi:hypothetical protein